MELVYRIMNQKRYKLSPVAMRTTFKRLGFMTGIRDAPK
jgi:hypothetical protein